jgi:hypothetical protein
MGSLDPKMYDEEPTGLPSNISITKRCRERGLSVNELLLDDLNAKTESLDNRLASIEQALTKFVAVIENFQQHAGGK